MKIQKLSTYLQELEKTASRLEITRILASLFEKSVPAEIDKVVYLILGTLAAPFENVVFNMADKLMIRAIAEAFGKKPGVVNETYKKLGDLGDTAALYAAAKPSNLTVSQVFERLRKLAEDEGEGSQERKVFKMAELLKEMDRESVRYTVRIPVGKLRLGFSDKTIIDALSWMETGSKSASENIEAAYQVLPDVGALAVQVKRHGSSALAEKVSPTIGVPVVPMLPQRLGSPKKMVKKMGTVSVEPKYDGLRTLIHYDKNGVKVFTRNLNDVSEMFPELGSMGKYTDAKEIMLDAEAVGIDPKTKRAVDFQKTMQRRRKHGIVETSKQIPIRFQVFDILMADGKSFMREPYTKRREILSKLIKKNKLLIVDEHTITDDPGEIQKLHKAFVDQGLEGVIVKRADSEYVPGRTGWRWVKMKEVEGAEGKLADTVDVLIMGYTQGKGKRAGFGIGQFLAGVKREERFLTVTKVGTGLSDEEFKRLNKTLQLIKVDKKPKTYNVHKDLEPDYWVSPEVVVELAADEITKSPKHTAGLALRFPRLVRFRDDKSPSQATTLKELKRIFDLQKNN